MGLKPSAKCTSAVIESKIRR